VLDKGSGAKPKPGSGSVGAASGSGSAPAGSGSGSNLAGSKRVVGPAVDTQKPEPLARAITVLRRYLDDKDSPRVQRVAAAALSRTGDKVAIERLASALAKDKLELAGQLDVAYALARAGDPRGVAALLGAVSGATRRDDKLAAGRLLVQLGHKGGVDALANYLEVPQHRLGAAEQLARVSEPRGMKVLETIHADKTASADDKARAVIGLGLAGKPEVIEELRALLTDNRFNVFAAEALALRHDEMARPVLVKQLELSSLRVGAARALRLLAPERDPAQYLDALIAALDDPSKQRDTEQIPLAEAILMLAGPARWAERT
jgi:HEAT repeat protein